MRKVMLLGLIVALSIVGMAAADSIAPFSDVTTGAVLDPAGDGLTSLTWGGTTYPYEALITGTTIRYYESSIDGPDQPWAEGDPVPADLVGVGGTSTAKVVDVGSHGDNFLWQSNIADISSLDQINYQETIFDGLVDTFFVFERGGNDSGTVYPILPDDTLGLGITLTSGSSYSNTGTAVGNQNAFGYVVQTDVKVKGIRIAASGHDALTVCTHALYPANGAHTPVPSDGYTVPSYDVLDTTQTSWYSPLQDGDGNPITDSNIVSVDSYDVWWSVGVEPNSVTDTPTNQTAQSYTPTTAITYDITYFWRVDTTVTFDTNEITGNFTDTFEGSTWSFTTEPAYTPPVIETYQSVITTLDIMPTTLSATVSNNSDPMGGPSFTLLTDDAEFPVGSDAAVVNTTTDNQNPTAQLTTTMAGTYKVLLVVSDGSGKEGSTQQAIAEVDVYADACQAQKDAGGWSANYYDRDDNCIVDMVDFSVLALEWLDSTAMDASEEYDGVADYVPQDVFDARTEAEWIDPNDPNACSDGPISDDNGIRIQDQPNASGLKATGYSSATAWVEYTITVPVSAVGVAVDVYAGHALNGSGSVTLSFGTEAVPDAYGVGTLDGTGNWTAFTDGRKIGEVTFTASGSQIVRTSYGGGLNLDWFSFDF